MNWTCAEAAGCSENSYRGKWGSGHWLGTAALQGGCGLCHSQSPSGGPRSVWWDLHLSWEQRYKVRAHCIDLWWMDWFTTILCIVWETLFNLILDSLRFIPTMNEMLVDQCQPTQCLCIPVLRTMWTRDLPYHLTWRSPTVLRSLTYRIVFMLSST